MISALSVGVDGADMVTESARAVNSTTAKKDLLGVLADLLLSGYNVDSVFRYMQKNADQIDAGCMRAFMSTLFGELTQPVWVQHMASFVDLIMHPNVVRTISSPHFRRDGVDNLRNIVAATNEEANKISDAWMPKWLDFKRMLESL